MQESQTQEQAELENLRAEMQKADSEKQVVEEQATLEHEPSQGEQIWVV